MIDLDFPLLTKDIINSLPFNKINGFYKTKYPLKIPGTSIWSNTNSFVHFKNGIIHNDNGPAMITLEKNTQKYTLVRYFINSCSHRDTGPAYISFQEEVVFKDGQFYGNENKMESCAFIVNGKRHNLQGPAICNRLDVIPSGINTYMINDKELSKNEWENHPKVLEHFGRINLKNKMKDTFTKGEQ